VLAGQTGCDLSTGYNIAKLTLLCEIPFLFFENKLMQIESTATVTSLISLLCTICNEFERHAMTLPRSEIRLSQ